MLFEIIIDATCFKQNSHRDPGEFYHVNVIEGREKVERT